MPSQLELSRAHRRSQDLLTTTLARLLLAQYRRHINGQQSADDIARWLEASLPLVDSFHTRSAAVAETFYARSRSLVDTNGEPPDASPKALVGEAVQTSFMVTGVVGLMKKLEAQMPPGQALEEAGDAAVGAAVRHALEGGRTYIQDVVTKDKIALGYYRETKEGCCSFCALLASRGAVFEEDSFADSDPQFRDDPDLPSSEKVHDLCHCSMWPVYRRTGNPLDDAPESSKLHRALWEAVVRPGGPGTQTLYTGKDAMNAFRRAYEATLAST